MADLRSRFDALGEDMAALKSAASDHGISEGYAIVTGWRDLLDDIAYAAEGTGDHLDSRQVMRPEFAIMLGIVGYRLRQCSDDLRTLAARYHVHG